MCLLSTQNPKKQINERKEYFKFQEDELNLSKTDYSKNK